MDLRVEAIRSDPNLGRGTCSMLDECYTDSELIAEMNSEDVAHDGEAGLNWAYDVEGLWREQGTNASSGEPDCPLVESYNEFEAARKGAGR